MDYPQHRGGVGGGEKVGDPQRNWRKNMKTLRSFENKYPHNKKISLEYITG